SKRDWSSDVCSSDLHKCFTITISKILIPDFIFLRHVYPVFKRIIAGLLRVPQYFFPVLTVRFNTKLAQQHLLEIMEPLATDVPAKSLLLIFAIGINLCHFFCIL